MSEETEKKFTNLSINLLYLSFLAKHINWFVGYIFQEYRGDAPEQIEELSGLTETLAELAAKRNDEIDEIDQEITHGYVEKRKEA